MSSGSPLDDLFAEEELAASAPRAPAAPKPAVRKQSSGLTAFKPKLKFTMAPSDWFIVACAVFQLMFLFAAFSGELDKDTLKTVVLIEFLIGLLVGLYGLIKGYRVYYKDDSVFQIGHGVMIVVCLIFGLLPLLLLVSYYLLIRPQRTADARALVLFGYIFFFGAWPGLALLGSAQRAEDQQAAVVASTSAAEVDFRELKRDAMHRIIGVYNKRGDSLGRLIYSVPPGEHEAKSLACVVMAPAGSNMMTGRRWAPGDDQEALQYVDAGMAVVVYELPGDVDMEGLQAGRVSDSDFVRAARTFWASGGGVRNAQYAMRWLEQNAAEIDPERLFAAGHSSAGTVALLVAARDARIKKVAVYAAPYEVASWFERPALTTLETILPELFEQLALTSPKTHAKDIQADIFIFHGKGDQVVAYSDSVAAAAHLRGLGKSVTMSSASGGNHYDSMIRQGIPRAIQWFNGQRPGSPRRSHGALRGDVAGSPPNSPAHSRKPAAGVAAAPEPPGLPGPPRQTALPEPPGSRRQTGLRRQTGPRFVSAPEAPPHYISDGSYEFDEALVCLSAGDGQDIAESMRWNAGKRCPVVGQRWGYAVHVPKPTRGNRSTLNNQARSGGLMIMQFSQSMTERLTGGPNGHWPRPIGKFPPMAAMPNGSEKKTLADAKSRGLDYLLFFEIGAPSPGTMKQYDAMAVTLYDTAKQKPLWSSPGRNASGRRGARPSQGRSVVDKLLAVIDSKCSLADMPQLEAEHVKVRLDMILSSPHKTKSRTLELVAEVRYYQARNLLEDDAANRAYQKLLDSSAASAMSGLDEGQRRRELRRWAGITRGW